MTEQTATSPKKPRRSLPRRIVRWLLILIVTAFFILYLILPIAIGIYGAVGISGSVGAPPDGFTAITLTTADNVELAAWYAPPQNGAVIILIHGAGGSRNRMRAYAQMLVDHNFGVLALDLRGHGESGGQFNRFGWDGTRDVSAAVNYLLGQDDVQVIGGLGSSLGGEVLLGAVGDNPALAAVVADGATYRSYEEFHALNSRRGFLRSASPWITFQVVGLLTGDSQPTPIIDSISASDAHLLLIAAGNVGDEIEYDTLFADTVGDRAEVWVVPDVGHTGAFRRYPDEYEQRVIAFFESTLLEG